MSVARPPPELGSGVGTRTRFGRIRGRARAAVRKICRTREGRIRCRHSLVCLLIGTPTLAALLASAGFYHIYFDRSNLPDLEAFARFEFPTIGRIYDANGRPLKELGTESRQISRYEEIPPIVRDAILAAEDKNFFSHSGVDYSGFARVLSKLRVGDLLGRLVRMGRRDAANNSAIFPQGGSTITQQLVRGYFLKTMMGQENSGELQHGQRLARVLSSVIGARTVNMLVRKVEEIRLSVWIEEQMQTRFGSKRRAKEEILARYASLIYMGNGQYGFAKGAEYYFGRPLSKFTAGDADKAALLAGTAKSARYYAPGASEIKRVLQRRNQTLELMASNGFITEDQAQSAEQRPIEVVAQHKDKGSVIETSAVVDNVLEELRSRQDGLGAKDLLQGRIQVYSTVDAGVQQVANQALERGLLQYEKRHPSARGLIQGSVVVLRNRDASILAETGGREFYKDRSSAYADFNRVTKSLRQPGSAMKPIVYLAAFREGTFNLESVVPDEPISVANGSDQAVKWISNYDGQFKGMIPLRMALAESRNTVAIWITQQIGVGSVLRTARNLGIQTPLRPYPTTALGASEVSLLELANAYRTIASGILTQPYIIRKIVRDSGELVADSGHESSPVQVDRAALSLIQEGLRSVVRMPTGTAHALDGYAIAVMGKTGTTNQFRDALFVGSTYGPDGITIAIRIGFDDNRPLGSGETGGRVALPVFKEVVLRAYGEKLVKPVTRFPAEMEQNIDVFLKNAEMDAVPVPEVVPISDGVPISQVVAPPAKRDGPLQAP
jgi:penicillin-binding protein 1A